MRISTSYDGFDKQMLTTSARGTLTIAGEHRRRYTETKGIGHNSRSAGGGGHESQGDNDSNDPFLDHLG
jgi:hypothetical protein